MKQRILSYRSACSANLARCTSSSLFDMIVDYLTGYEKKSASKQRQLDL